MFPHNQSILKRILTLLVVLFMVSTTHLFAQMQYQPPIRIEAGYYGETATHPGFSLALGINLLTNEWYNLAPRIKLSWYMHKHNHQGLQLSAGFLQKAFLPSGFGFELESMVGVLYTKVDGKL